MAETRTPEEIQAAMKRSKAAGDTVATAKLRARLKASYEVEAAEMTGASTESFGTNLLAGVGSGMVDVGRKATNLVLPEGMTPDWASDEAIAEQGRTDEDLMSTGAGLTGNILGGAVATAPVGFGAGALVGRALPAALKAAGTWGKVGGRALRGMGQGAAEGAVLASPDNRGLGVALGAGLGGGLPLAAGAIGKGWRGLGKGVADITEDAASLERSMIKTGAEDLLDSPTLMNRKEAISLSAKGGIDKSNPDFVQKVSANIIPLSQAAKPGFVKQIYEGFVSNIPFNSLRQQRIDAVEKFRELVLKNAIPEGVSPSSVFKAESTDSIQKGFKNVIEEWDKAWKPINNTPVNIPRNLFPEDLRKLLRREGFELPAAGPNKGKALTEAAQAMQEMANNAAPGVIGSQQRAMYIAAKDNINNFLRSKLPREAAEVWDKNKLRYGDYQKLLSGAAGKVGTGEFTPQALAQAAGKAAGTEGLGGAGGVMQRLGGMGQRALPDFPSKQGIFQTLAATGAAGGAAGTAMGGWGEGTTTGAVLGVILPILGARQLAKPSVQRALRDGWGIAKKSGMTLDTYRKGIERVGTGVNQAVIATALEELK